MDNGKKIVSLVVELGWLFFYSNDQTPLGEFSGHECVCRQHADVMLS